MSRVLRIALVLSMAIVAGTASPAAAACHAFTVSVDPAEVTEGGEVTVTVERDAAVAESSIDVSTVDGTATGGTDYEPLDETADFPDGGTSQTFTVPTMDREGSQGDRDFQVELSNPQGCAPNTDYEVGDPATVTIADSEQAAATEDPTEEPTEEATAEATGDELPETGADLTVVVAAGLLVLLAGLALRRRARAR